ncbi:MAG: hypothetical protein Q8R15_02890 [Candidatus Micrarchaeota archaeon]|nr:hypothetical protein [Candidatus Micrarchaeota archaeon]
MVALPTSALRYRRSSSASELAAAHAGEQAAISALKAKPWHEKAASHFGEAHGKEGNASVSSSEKHPDVLVRFTQKAGRPIAVLKHASGPSLEVTKEHEGNFYAPKGTSALSSYADLLAAAQRAHKTLKIYAP